MVQMCHNFTCLEISFGLIHVNVQFYIISIIIPKGNHATTKQDGEEF